MQWSCHRTDGFVPNDVTVATGVTMPIVVITTRAVIAVVGTTCFCGSSIQNGGYISLLGKFTLFAAGTNTYLRRQRLWVSVVDVTSVVPSVQIRDGNGMEYSDSRGTKLYLYS